MLRTLNFSEIVDALNKDINARYNSVAEGTIPRLKTAYEKLFRMALHAALEKHKHQSANHDGYIIPKQESVTLTVNNQEIEIIFDLTCFVRLSDQQPEQNKEKIKLLTVEIENVAIGKGNFGSVSSQKIPFQVSARFKHDSLRCIEAITKAGNNQEQGEKVFKFQHTVPVEDLLEFQKEDAESRNKEIINETNIHKTIAASPKKIRTALITTENTIIHVLTMPKASGELLATVMKTNRVLSDDNKKRCLLSYNLIDAVARFNEKKHAHKDLKPKNIFFNPHTFDITLVDYGCSQPLLEYNVQRGGTCFYISPEMLKEASVYNHEKHDAYALGLILFGLSSGQNIDAWLVKIFTEYRSTQDPGDSTKNIDPMAYLCELSKAPPKKGKDFWTYLQNEVEKEMDKNMIEVSIQKIILALINPDEEKRLTATEARNQFFEAKNADIVETVHSQCQEELTRINTLKTALEANLKLPENEASMNLKKNKEELDKEKAKIIKKMVEKKKAIKKQINASNHAKQQKNNFLSVLENEHKELLNQLTMDYNDIHEKLKDYSRKTENTIAAYKKKEETLTAVMEENNNKTLTKEEKISYVHKLKTTLAEVSKKPKIPQPLILKLSARKPYQRILAHGKTKKKSSINPVTHIAEQLPQKENIPSFNRAGFIVKKVCVGALCGFIITGTAGGAAGFFCTVGIGALPCFILAGVPGLIIGGALGLSTALAANRMQTPAPAREAAVKVVEKIKAYANFFPAVDKDKNENEVRLEPKTVQLRFNNFLQLC